MLCTSRAIDSTAPSRARLESMQLQRRYAANLVTREEFNTAMEPFMAKSRKYMKEVDKHRCDGNKVYGRTEEYISPPMNANQFYQNPNPMRCSPEMGGSTDMSPIPDRGLSRSDMRPMSPIASYGMSMSPSPAMDRNSKKTNREGMMGGVRRGTRSDSPLGSPPRLAGGRMRTTMRGHI